ncbi:MAG: hypothetical protein QXL64_08710, partial [Thermofilaceae archaeon]
RVVEPGEFVVMVGSSSEDIRLTGSFKIAGKHEARFVLESFEVERCGGALTVRARVANAGDVTDVARIAVRVDGRCACVYPVELAPGERRDATIFLKGVEGKSVEAMIDGSACST